MKIMLLSLTVLTSLLFTKVAAEQPQSTVEEAMRDKIGTLGQVSSFAYVDLGLTDQELCLIDQLVCETTVEYDRFGNLHLLKDELPGFLSSIGNDDENVIQVVTEIIIKTVQNVTKASNKNSAWVSVRASTPTDKYDIPRWHTDGSYYGPYPYPGVVFKFAAVLKGSPTLLYNLPDDMRAKFNANRNNRIVLSELLEINKAESPKKGEGVFFVVGDSLIGAVHSEPKMSENRLFFSILVGDESEINELYQRWHP